MMKTKEVYIYNNMTYLFMNIDKTNMNIWLG